MSDARQINILVACKHFMQLKRNSTSRLAMFKFISTGVHLGNVSGLGTFKRMRLPGIMRELETREMCKTIFL